MKSLKILKSGFFRSLSSWKGVLMVWLLMFFLTAAIAMPVRGVLKTAFGNSMMPEKLALGYDLEVFADLGPVLKTLISQISSGFVIAFLIGFVMNAFLTGGLFSSLRGMNSKFSYSDFFREGARNFGAFMIILLAVSLIFPLIFLLIIFVPSVISGAFGDGSERSVLVTGMISVALGLLIMPVILLTADYARAWKVTNDNASGFRALGFGFKQTFRKFRSSYPVMLALMLIQIACTAAVLPVMAVWKPVSGKGVMLLFIVTQVLLFLKFLLRTWRYGSITALREKDGPANENHAHQVLTNENQ
ncbi:MAG: hypothetical protein WCE64_15115 [Bacteroidales bacterium]